MNEKHNLSRSLDVKITGMAPPSHPRSKLTEKFFESETFKINPSEESGESNEIGFNNNLSEEGKNKYRDSDESDDVEFDDSVGVEIKIENEIEVEQNKQENEYGWIENMKLTKYQSKSNLDNLDDDKKYYNTISHSKRPLPPVPQIVEHRVIPNLKTSLKQSRKTKSVYQSFSSPESDKNEFDDDIQLHRKSTSYSKDFFRSEPTPKSTKAVRSKSNSNTTIKKKKKKKK